MLEAVIAYHERQLNIAQGVLDTDGNLYSHEMRSRAEIDAANHRSFLVILRVAQKELVGAFPQWQHLKRGSIYSEVGELIVQTEAPIHDNDRLTLYRGVDGQWFGRPPAEFKDGRFAPVIDDPDGKVVPLETTTPETITFTLVTGEDDDCAITLPTAKVQAAFDTQRLSLGPADIAKEDYWGTYRIQDSQGSVSRRSLRTLYVKRV